MIKTLIEFLAGGAKPKFNIPAGMKEISIQSFVDEVNKGRLHYVGYYMVHYHHSYDGTVTSLGFLDRNGKDKKNFGIRFDDDDRLPGNDLFKAAASQLKTRRFERRFRKETDVLPPLTRNLAGARKDLKFFKLGEKTFLKFTPPEGTGGYTTVSIFIEVDKSK